MKLHIKDHEKEEKSHCRLPKLNIFGHWVIYIIILLSSKIKERLGCNPEKSRTETSARALMRVLRLPAVLYPYTHSKTKIKMGGSWGPGLSGGGDSCLRCHTPLAEVESSVRECSTSFCSCPASNGKKHSWAPGGPLQPLLVWNSQLFPRHIFRELTDGDFYKVSTELKLMTSLCSC